MDPSLDTARHLKKRALLRAYEATGNLSVAARLSGTSRKNHYYWLDHDPSYAAAFVEAKAAAVDALLQEARRRAVDGVAEPVYQRGRLVGHVQRYSDVLLIYLLKTSRAERHQPVRAAPVPRSELEDALEAAGVSMAEVAAALDNIVRGA